MQPERLPDINLLPKYERQSANLFYWFIAFIIIILLAYLVIGYYYFTGKNDVEALETEVAQLSTEVESLQIELDQLSNDSQSTLEQSVTFVENYEIPTSLLIAELDDLLVPNSYLSEYRYSSQVAEITTHFETLDKIADYTSSLNTLDYIKDTKVDDIETFEFEDEEENYIDFGKISRYEVNHTLEIHKQNLKEGAEADE